MNNMGLIYDSAGEYSKGLEIYEQALLIRRATNDRKGEATTCFNMALLLRAMGQSEQAVEYFRQGTTLGKQLQDTHYLDDMEILSQWEAALANGAALPDLPPYTGELPRQQVQTFAGNTLFVITDAPEQKMEWRESMVGMLKEAQLRKRQAEIEFFAALLDLLNGKTSNLLLKTHTPGPSKPSCKNYKLLPTRQFCPPISSPTASPG